jgi:exodeoxyribonuclease VII small subunit
MAKFEDDLAELEKVVERLEQGDLSLEESVDLYERGVLLSRACKGVLRRVDARIEALVDPEEDGPVRVEDVAMAVAEGEEDEEEDEENEHLLDRPEDEDAESDEE